MIKHVARRTGRIALTIGPLAAIALTLAAGLKWHGPDLIAPFIAPRRALSDEVFRDPDRDPETSLRVSRRPGVLVA